MTTKRSLLVGCLLFACGGESLNVGNDVANQSLVPTLGAGGGGGLSAGGAGSTGGSGQNAPPLGCRTDPGYSAVVGTWDGDLEDDSPRPVEHIRIVISGANFDGLCGTLTWGEKTPFPPADDPNALYPSADYWTPFGYGGSPAQFLPPVEGFPYTLTGNAARLPNVQLSVVQSEPWTSWCQLQTPVLVNDESRPATNGWACAHVGSECDASPNISADEAFMCGACEATGPLCTCSSASCYVVKDSKQAFILTLSADSQTLTGVFQPALAFPQPAWESSNTSLYLARVAE